MKITIVDLLDQHARARGQEICITDREGSWTYKKIQRASVKIARELRKLGVKKGDRIGLLTTNVIEYPIVVFAAWRIGAAIVPINHKLTWNEVEYVVEHAGINIGVYEADLKVAEGNELNERGWITTREIGNIITTEERSDEEIINDSKAEDLAELLYTSGTTGKPKGCMHTHRNVYMASMLTAAGFQLVGKDKILISMPIWHSSPMNNWLLGGIFVGAHIVLMKEYGPVEFIEYLEKYKITLTFVAPIALLMPINMGVKIDRRKLRNMRLTAYGGGPLGEDMVKVIEKKYGEIGLVQVYGMTETGPNGTALYEWEGKGQEGSVGRSGTPGMEVEVRKRDGEVCSEGEIGEIYIRSPAMMEGYWGDAAATSEVLDEEGWFRTGDIAKIKAGGYIYIMDRAKDMIITGGENVYSKEVEDAIGGYEDVLDVAVVGLEDKNWGETVVAVIVKKKGSGEIEEELRKYVGARLAEYKQPRRYMWAEELPRTPSGKLKKFDIREKIRGGQYETKARV